MKRILVLIHNDRAQSARADAELDLVRTFDGQLIALRLQIAPFVEAHAARHAPVVKQNVFRGDGEASVRDRLTRQGGSFRWLDELEFVTLSRTERARLRSGCRQ